MKNPKVWQLVWSFVAGECGFLVVFAGKKYVIIIYELEL